MIVMCETCDQREAVAEQDDRPVCRECKAGHRRDPSWRCTVLDPFTNRDYREGISTYLRCPACAAYEDRVMAELGLHLMAATRDVRKGADDGTGS